MIVYLAHCGRQVEPPLGASRTAERSSLTAQRLSLVRVIAADNGLGALGRVGATGRFILPLPTTVRWHQRYARQRFLAAPDY